MADEKEESFAAMFEREAMPAKRPRMPRVGDRIEGVVVRVGKDSVFVELDGKRQAFIESVELGGDLPKEGDTIAATVVEADEKRGIVRLGRTMGRPGNVAELEQARAAGLAIEGKITGVNKGGLEVDVGGARAFCPMSQIDQRRVEDADAKAMIGQTIRVLVTDIRDGGKSVVVSRRALLEREASERAQKAIGNVVPGAVLTGTVTGVRDFGAFVDLGGVEGLIPRSEIAHDRSVDVKGALSAGNTVEVRVLEVKDGGKKITLSLKALMADPWEGLAIQEGRVALGTVVRTSEHGLFVRLAPGVDGLLHVSELGKGDKPAEGTELRVVPKKIDRASKKISLVPAPDGAEVGALALPSGDVKVGAIVTGAVDRIEQYGIFVQIDGTKGRAGRGLVPLAELGVSRGTDLRKTFPEGTRVTAKVLETGEGRLRLSIKGANADAERADYEGALDKAQAPASLGTLADLLKGKKL